MDSTDSNNTPPADLTAQTPAERIDARGLRCPMPLLQAKQALNRVAAGELVQVLATDAGAARDFPAFAQLSGHVLLHHGHDGEVYEFIIQKRPESSE